MRRVRASMVAVLVGGLLIAGCAGQPVLYNHFVNSGYSPTEFGVGAGRKDLRTVLQRRSVRGRRGGVRGGDDRAPQPSPAVPSADPLHHHAGREREPPPSHGPDLRPAADPGLPAVPRAPAGAAGQARRARARAYPARRGRVLPARRRADGGAGQDRGGRAARTIPSSTGCSVRSSSPCSRRSTRTTTTSPGWCRTPRAGLIRREPRAAGG